MSQSDSDKLAQASQAITPAPLEPPGAEIRENAAIKFSVSRYVLSLGVFIAFVI